MILAARRSRPFRLVAALAASAALLAACSDADAGADDDGTVAATEEEPASEAAERGLELDGPDDGEVINAEQLETLTFTVSTTDDGGSLDGLTLLLDGTDVTADADVATTTLTYAPGELPDGERVIELVDGEPLHAWRFEVKATPPDLELISPDGPVSPDEPVVLAGSTEPGATVAVGDASVTAGDDGDFELELATVDPTLPVVVTDRAGNTVEHEDLLVTVGSRVSVDTIRGVHMAWWAWPDAELREPVLEMIDDGKLTAVQLDLKDEGGQLGYLSEVPLAQEMGATRDFVDLEATVADLHERGVAVVGRIVAFADPVLASWAWENGNRDWVIQVPDGSDFYRGSYAGFSNYTNPEVIDYLLDIAEEAASLGVDHILWDYIRRPEGLENYTVPGLTTTPEEAIVAFTQQADERLAPYGVQHGASVYGIAADRPTQIGQDIPGMADHLDYVAPMIYPSHWGAGEYGIDDPNARPYDIVRATLQIWNETVEGHRARVVPWLEDTAYRSWDRPFQIREQIRGAADEGIDEWLMWNPSSRFTYDAYEPS
jgi:hypothetical protein